MEVALVLWALGATGCGQLAAPVEVRVERLELNHICHLQRSEDGRVVTAVPSVDYWNLWGWYGFPEYDFHVQEWDTVRKGHVLLLENGQYVLYARGESGGRYRIRADVFVETWTLHDPERVDADVFAIKHRRRISGFRPN